MAPVATGTDAMSNSTDLTSTAAAAVGTPTATTTTASLPASHEEAQAHYLALKSNLNTTLAKKRAIDKTLADLESQIWLFEGSYFAATLPSGGNIVKGFDGYLKDKTTIGSGRADLLGVGDIAPEERVFSNSSLTYQRSLELKAKDELLKQQEKEKGGSGSGSSKKDDKKGSKKRSRDD